MTKLVVAVCSYPGARIELMGPYIRTDELRRRCRELVQGIREAPARGLLVEIFDLIWDPADPVPAHGFDRAKPRSPKAGVGDQDRLAPA